MLEPIIEEDEDKTVEIHTTQNTINLLRYFYLRLRLNLRY